MYNLLFSVSAYNSELAIFVELANIPLGCNGTLRLLCSYMDNLRFEVYLVINIMCSNSFRSNFELYDRYVLL
jgi:hypothetical protein